MKKTIWILCMTVILGTSVLFAGCSNTSDDNTAEKTTAESSSADDNSLADDVEDAADDIADGASHGVCERGIALHGLGSLEDCWEGIDASELRYVVSGRPVA